MGSLSDAGSVSGNITSFTKCWDKSFDSHVVQVVKEICRTGASSLKFSTTLSDNGIVRYAIQHVNETAGYQCQEIPLTAEQLDAILDGDDFTIEGVKLSNQESNYTSSHTPTARKQIILDYMNGCGFNTRLAIPHDIFIQLQSYIDDVSSDCAVMDTYLKPCVEPTVVRGSQVKKSLTLACLHYTYQKGLKFCVNHDREWFAQQLIDKVTVTDVNSFLRHSKRVIEDDEPLQTRLWRYTGLAEELTRLTPTPSMIYFAHLLYCRQRPNEGDNGRVDASALGLLSKVDFQ